MVDVANLKIDVQSQGAVKAKRDLDNLTASAGRLQKSMVAAANGSNTAMQKLVNQTTKVNREHKSAAASANVMVAALDKERQSFDRLRNSIDPLFAAQQRFKTQVEQIQMAHRRGIATQEEMNRVLVAAKTQYDIAAAAAVRYNTVAVATARGSNRAAAAATQVGFQVQDFAVQVAAGTNAMLALNQQLPQLLGAFGSFGKIALFGSILGTVAAVSLAVLPKLLALNDVIKQMDKSAGSAEEAVEDYHAALARVIPTAQELRDQFTILAAEMGVVQQAMADLAEVRAFRALGTAVAETARNLRDFGGADSQAIRDALQGRIDLQAEEQKLRSFQQQNLEFFGLMSSEMIKAQNAEVATAQQRINAATNLQGALDGLAKKYGVTEDRARDLVAQLAELQDIGTPTNAEEVGRVAELYATITSILTEQLRIHGGLTSEGEKLLEISGRNADTAADMRNQLLGASDELYKMNDASDAVGMSIQEALKATEDFADEVFEAYKAGKDFSNLNLAGGILPAVTAAEALAQKLGISLGLAQRLAGLSAMSNDQKLAAARIRSGVLPPGAAESFGLNAAGTAIDPGAENRALAMAADLPRITMPDNPKISSGSKRGGGGGGGSAKKSEAEKEAEKERNELLKERDAIIERSKSNLELYTDAVARLDEIQQVAGLTTEQYNSELDILAQKYLDAGGAAEFFRTQQQTLIDGFLDAIVKGEDFVAVLRNVAQNIAKAALQAALFGSGPMANLFGQTPGTGFLSSILPFARGTNYAPGGAALVGEEGPELVNLPQGSKVHSASETQSMLRNASKDSGAAPTVNNKIVNVLDPSLIGQYLNTPQGEQLVLNIVTANRDAVMS